MLHGNERIVKHKIGLLNLAEELTNVSRACKIMGLSRDTFYRYKAAVENGGIDDLIDKSRRKPNIKNRVEEMIETAVVDYAVEQPAHGQVRASNELRKRGIFISPSGVRCVWLRNQLGRFKDRLKALEEKMAQERLILTEAQVQALEKKKGSKKGSSGFCVPGCHHHMAICGKTRIDDLSMSASCFQRVQVSRFKTGTPKSLYQGQWL